MDCISERLREINLYLDKQDSLAILSGSKKFNEYMTRGNLCIIILLLFFKFNEQQIFIIFCSTVVFQLSNEKFELEHTGHPRKTNTKRHNQRWLIFFAREKHDLSSKYMFYQFLTKVAWIDFCDLYKIKEACVVCIFS